LNGIYLGSANEGSVRHNTLRVSKTTPQATLSDGRLHKIIRAEIVAAITHAIY